MQDFLKKNCYSCKNVKYRLKNRGYCIIIKIYNLVFTGKTGDTPTPITAPRRGDKAPRAPLQPRRFGAGSVWLPQVLILSTFCHYRGELVTPIPTKTRNKRKADLQ